jgi:hypothetical protein
MFSAIANDANQRKTLTGSIQLLYNSFPRISTNNSYPTVPAAARSHGIKVVIRRAGPTPVALPQHVSRRCSYAQNISTEKKAALERAWFSQTHVDKKRAQSSCQASGKRQGETFGIRNDEIHDFFKKEP